MFILKVLLLSLKLYATEPDYDEYFTPIEPEVISIDLTYRQLTVGEIIIDPYEELRPVYDEEDYAEFLTNETEIW